MTAQTAADLRAAADVLERDGWTQGDYTDGRGCHCVIGAIGAVHGDPRVKHTDDYDEHRKVLLSILKRNPATWNDEPGRTAAEVIAALRAAADEAQAQGHGRPKDAP